VLIVSTISQVNCPVIINTSYLGDLSVGQYIVAKQLVEQSEVWLQLLHQMMLQVHNWIPILHCRNTYVQRAAESTRTEAAAVAVDLHEK